MTDRDTSAMSLGQIVSRDPDVHSGALVFAGTRVPVDTLVEYLKRGCSIDDFVAGFPSVVVFRGDGSANASAKVVLKRKGMEDTVDVLASTGRIKVVRK